MSVLWTTADGDLRRGPSWAELVDQATRQLGFEDPDLARVRGTDLQILEYFKLRHGGETAKLTNWLTQNMNPPDDALRASRIHQAIVSLTRLRLIYTTNYDNFLERSFALAGRPPSVTVTELDLTFSTDVEIVKFHGDLDHPADIVLTESDYEKRLSFETLLDSRLKADLFGRVVLFVGYSFRDPNVAYLFRLFVSGFGGELGNSFGPRAYIVAPDPSEFENELFRARKLHVIPVSGHKLSEEVADLLRQLEG